MASTVAGEISRALRAMGMELIFGNPGNTELPFLADIVQRYVLSLHDGLAVGAADAYAQVLRRPALVNLHAAPGVGNSMAFLDTALRNRAPLVVTVGEQDRRHRALHPLLSGDIGAMVRPVSKGYLTVDEGRDVVPVLTRAWEIASSRPWGPVVVGLPMDLMETPYEGRDPLPPSQPPIAVSGDVAPVVEALRSATNPVIVAGYEVDIDDAFGELEALADRLQCPIYAEPLASRAPVAADSAHFMGDLLPASAMINASLALHDVVLLVGGALTLYPYTASPLLQGKRVLYLGTDAEVPRLLGIRESLVGPCREGLAALLAKLPPRSGTFRRPRDLGRAGRVARSRATMGAEFVLDSVASLFEEHLVLDEAVSNTPVLKRVGFYRGKDSYLASRSGQMGWALAAAVGAGLARPRTLAVVGDGALLYSPQALWTLAREGIPAKVLVLNNHGYSILRSYSKSFHPALTDAPFLQIPGLDVVGVSRSMGVPAETVKEPGELAPALRELRDSPGPRLLNVEIDPEVPSLFS